MKGLDLSGFKKIASDGKTSTLKHAKGHELKIMHAALPAIQREQLKRLPMDERKLEHLDEGGVAGSEKPLEVEPFKAEAQSGAAAPKEVSLDVQQPANPVEPPAPAPVAQAPQDFSTGAVGAEQEAINSDQAAKAITEKAYPIVQKAAQDFDEYQKKNPVNPKHWAESLDSKQKSDVAMGMFLMGLGGTAQTGLDFINKQIERDVQSQQQNFENKKTVFGAYHTMFNDADIAAKMALASTNDIYAHRVNMAAMKAGTPEAMQAAANFDNQKKIENAQLHGEVAKDVADKQLNPDQILKSGYNQRLVTLKFHPLYKGDFEKIQTQVQQAEQAQKAINQVKAVWPELVKNATVSGRISRSVNPHSIAALGGGLGALLGPTGAAVGATAGEAIGQIPQLAAAGNDETKAYKADAATITGIIGNALRGSNVSPTELAEIVKVNMPEQGDPPELQAHKLQNILDKIKTAVPTNLLKQTGLLQGG